MFNFFKEPSTHVEQEELNQELEPTEEGQPEVCNKSCLFLFVERINNIHLVVF